MSETLGKRNNNYLHVKNGATPWLDKDGKDSGTDERGHAVFKDPAYGVRAGILTLRAYFFKHQLRTIAQILARWAPVTDTIGSLPGAPRNSPIEYSTFVAGRMGISYNRTLDIFDEDKSIGNLSRLKQLFFAMAAFENGGGFQVPEAVFAAGVRLLEPDIDLLGTESNDSGAESTSGLSPDAANWAIGASVGRWNKGAHFEFSAGLSRPSSIC
jgi:hypothetical protein